MRKKKITLMISLIAVLVVLIASLFLLSPKAANVYDEMYLTMKSSSGDKYTSLITPNFSQRNTHFSGNMYGEDPQSRYYRPEFLRENESLAIAYSESNKGIVVIYSYKLEDEYLSITYRYYSEKKELVIRPIRVVSEESMAAKGLTGTEDKEFVLPFLEEKGITRTQIEEIKEFIIFERVLPDWFMENWYSSEFSMDNLGDFTVVDETYSMLGEGWE